MDADSYDIVVTNGTTNSSIKINFKDKKLNAEEIYNLFAF